MPVGILGVVPVGILDAVCKDPRYSTCGDLEEILDIISVEILGISIEILDISIKILDVSVEI